MRVAAALCALGLLFTGCQKSGGKGGKDQGGVGRRIAEDGEVAKVSASPDGKWIAFLGQVEKSKEMGVPEGALMGLLEVVPSDGAKPARQLLGGVSNLEGGFGFSSDSKVLAAIKGWRFADRAGTLEVVTLPDGEPKLLAERCQSFHFSPDARWLAWTAGGEAWWSSAEGGTPTKLVEGTATLQWTRDGKVLVVRRATAAGGALLAFEAGNAKPRTVAEGVGDYALSADGAAIAFTQSTEEGGWKLSVAPLAGGPARALGEGVARFSFSPDGSHVAWVSGISPSRMFGDLFVAKASEGAGVQVGTGIEEYRFAPRGDGVAFLEKFDGNARTGTLMLQRLPLGQPPVRIHRPAKQFEWSPQGGYLAFSALQLRPAISVDLVLADVKALKNEEVKLDGGAASITTVGTRKLANGVFGHEFLSEASLLYRTDCIAEGRACDLYVLPTGSVATPARLTGGVWRFALSKDGKRILVTYPRFDSETVADIGALNLYGHGGVAGIDKKVIPGALFLDPGGKRVAFGVIDKVRRGVYVADVPLPDPDEPPPPSDAPGMKPYLEKWNHDGGKAGSAPH